MKNNKNFIYLICFILLILVVIFIKNMNSKEPNEENNLSKIKAMNEEILESESNINEDSLKVLDAILNIEKIQTAKLDGQIKFLSINNNTYQDLLSLSIYANYIKDEKTNIKGLIDLNIASLDTKLNFPMIANDIGNEDFEIYLEIPSSYRESFEMTQEEEYLYISTNNIKQTEELFDLKRLYEKEDTLKKEIDIIGSIHYNELDSTSGIYDINLDNDNIVYLYNLISSDNKYKNNIFFQNILMFLLKDKSNIDNISSFTGQVAVSNDFATDIYIEIENYSGSVIAFRLTLNDINSDLITIEEFKTDKIKDFYEFMKTLQVEINKKSNKNNKKSINIGNIYFTGEDEALEKNTFNISKLDSMVNVFINFSKCSKNTDLVIKWYYDNQEVPIVENKLSNGEYEEGILKSSISFTDSIPEGEYTIKIYIDGIDKVQGESIFTIK